MSCAFKRPWFILAVTGTLLLSALFVVNLRFARSNPGGNDFLPRWVGTRLYITERISPYSAEATAAIHEAIYGRSAQPNEDQALFAYPFYSVFIFAPFAFIPDYAIARAAWITVQELAIVFTAVAAITFSGWRPSRWSLAAFLLFALTWYHGARPLVDGNASILVTAFLAAGLLAIRLNRDYLAGVLFALSTIKPQMVLLPLVFIFLWAYSQKRKSAVSSTVLATAILAGVSFALQPGWLLENLQQVMTYQSYLPPMTPAGIWGQWWADSGRAAGWALNVAICGLLMFEWWQSLGKGYDWFLWTLCVTIAASPLTGLIATSSNYAMFLLVLPCIFAFWQKRVGQDVSNVILLDLLILLVGLWALFLLTLQPGPQFREHSVMFFPAPIILLANLYWLRWWIVKPLPKSPTKQFAT